MDAILVICGCLSLLLVLFTPFNMFLTMFLAATFVFVMLHDEFLDLDDLQRLLAFSGIAVLLASIVPSMVPIDAMEDIERLGVLLLSVSVLYLVACMIHLSRDELGLFPVVFWSPRHHPRAACISMVGLFMATTCIALCLPRVLCEDTKSHHVRREQWKLCADPQVWISLVLCISIMGAWIGPVFMAWLAALDSQPADRIDRMLLHLVESKVTYVHPYFLRFSARHLLSKTHDCRDLKQRKNVYAIRVAFHQGILFALDNYTLMSARQNSIAGDTILVLIVDKPAELNVLLRNDARPFDNYFNVDIIYDIPGDIPMAMRIPAYSSFPTSQAVPHVQEGGERERELCGSIVLLADRVVKPREKLVNLIRARHPELGVQDPPGDLPRHYACLRTQLKHEAATRAAIKALGKERGKSSINIKVLDIVFDSPRD